MTTEYKVSILPGIGTILAVILSWTVNKSILYAIVHGILSWLYVIYWMLAHKG